VSRPAPPPPPEGAYELVANGTSSSASGRLRLDGTGSLLVLEPDALLAVRVVRLRSQGAGRALADVRVSRSTVAGCAAGATGTLEVRDEPDRIALRVCGLSRAWTAAATVAFRPRG
jgi:hypothetical protein